jgi:oligoribonuclease
MKPSSNNLIWLDLEMTGLEPEHDRILEIAVVVTDKHLNIIAEGPALVVHQSDAVLDKMDEWNTKHHGESGLVERVKVSHIKEAEAEETIIKFLEMHVPPKKSPMCGNTIYQDRRFLFKYMPKLEQYFHYRNLDVSTVKVLGKHWYPKIVKEWKKQTKHQALSDIYDSINELKFYRENIFIGVRS